MKFDDFKEGVSFLYKDHPSERIGTVGIGEVLECNDCGAIKVSWIWKDRCGGAAGVEWYSSEYVAFWQEYCTPLDKKEKLKLLLKYNFSSDTYS